MTFLDEARRIKAYTVERRRDFHKHPELGFEETRTAGIVAETLEELGLEVTTGVGGTGVVGLLRGKADSQVLLLRFDMDALPIQEENEVDYASEAPGKMHACGHDSHVAVGLSVAKLLAPVRDSLNGTVKFVFQPAEEGGGGAMRMVEAGVLKDPVPDYAMGMHVWNDKPVGWYGLTRGPAMAGAEIFTIKLTGKGGHGAAPHQTVDSVVASAQIITAAQTIVSRNVSPLESAVISICQVEAGTAFNIIPQEAVLKGTIRAFKPEVFEIVNNRLKALAHGIAEAMGCVAEIGRERVTLPVTNDSGLVDLMTEVVRAFDPEAKIGHDLRTMGSEDFSFMMDEIPGCFIFVGSSNADKGLNFAHHHPRFDIDEACLLFAVAILAQGAAEILKEQPESLTNSK